MPSGFGHDIDHEHLQALRRGSRSALASVYDRFAGPVYGLALRVLANPDDAADLVQDVFLKLPKAARRYRGDAPFGLWLRRLAINATIDQLRDRRRLVSLETVRHQLADESPPADAVEAQGLLERLSPSARLVLLLHAVEGYTHTEMAELFDQSESYSKSILSRALRRLRDRLTTENTHGYRHEKSLRAK